MEVPYTWWEADDGFVGYLDKYPNYPMWGHDIADLEKKLSKLYIQILRGEEKRLDLKRKSGVLKINISRETPKAANVKNGLKCKKEYDGYDR